MIIKSGNLQHGDALARKDRPPWLILKTRTGLCCAQNGYSKRDDIAIPRTETVTDGWVVIRRPPCKK